MSKMKELLGLGQSIWLDYVKRSFTRSGELAGLVDRGLRGVTSNPTIFEKAITGSDDGGCEAAYEHLAITDIREAADVLRPVYEESACADGYVSLEVSPELAHDTEGTIAAAKRLFATVDRPNLMIKIPATPEGIPAIRSAIAAGINVNVTLIFSLANYETVTGAYIAGLEDLLGRGGYPSRIASVASFFVSRIDVAVEKRLAELGAEPVGPSTAGDRWERLERSGARTQRLLWASTGTKSDMLPDTFYVDELIGGPTVNTVPPATLDAFLDHGTVASTLDRDVAGARERMARLARIGVDFDRVTADLQDAGVDSFAESFAALLSGVKSRMERLRSN